MKKVQTPLLKLLTLSSLLIPSAVFAAETVDIWLYTFLIPIYFVLIAQVLLVLFALMMKHFKTKQSVLLSAVIAGIFMILGIGVSFYFQPMEELWAPLMHYFLIGIVVFIFPYIQYTLLSKSENSPDENQA